MLVGIAVAVPGCGGGEAGSGGDQSAEVAAVVEKVVAFEDPATVCETSFTEHMLEESHDGGDRDARVEDCADDETGELDDIEVSEVEIDGDTATARVTGSDKRDGEFADFTVELVDEDGWKVDGFR